MNFIGPASGARIQLPNADEPSPANRSIGAEVVFPASHRGFQGHFPGYAILPGFLHIEVVLDILRQRTGPVEITAIRRMKFLRPIKPEETVTLTLLPRGKGRLEAKLQVAQTPVCEMELEWAEEPAGGASSQNL